MVQEADIHEFKGGLDPPRNPLVGLARFGDTGRVIMRQDDRRGVHRQGLLDDFTWIDAGAIYGPAKQLLKTNNSVSVIEIQAAKQLMRQVTQFGGQEGLRIGGAADGLSCWQGRFAIPLGQFGKRPENREP